MQEKLKQIAASIKPFLDRLKPLESGSLLNAFRSEQSTREAYQDDSVYCVLQGIHHLENPQSDKPGDDLNECVKWLDQAAAAYKKIGDPTEAQQLAEAVRLDIVTQLFAFSGAHYYILQQKIIHELSVPGVQKKHELEKSLKLTTGLVGFLLGRSLEVSDEAMAVYGKLKGCFSSHTFDKEVEQRQACLSDFSFLTAEDLDMHWIAFQAVKQDRAMLQQYVAKCCQEGWLSIEKAESNVLHDMMYAAGLVAVFTFPVGLVVLIPAVVSAPFLYLWDHKANRGAQKENELFYHLIEIANEWTKQYFANQGKQYYPNIDKLIDVCEKSKQKVKRLVIEPAELFEKIRLLNDKIKFNKTGTPVQQQNLKNANSQLQANKKEIANYCSRVEKLVDKIDSFIYYLKNPKEVLSQQGQFNDRPIGAYSQELQSEVDDLVNDYEKMRELLSETTTERSRLEEDYRSIKAQAAEARGNSESLLQQVQGPFSY